MSEVTVIGLGAMGSAIAKSLFASGIDVTVWNRSAEKSAALAASGIHAANSLQQAVESSPVLIICIHGYASTHAMLGVAQIKPLVAGRTIIQMSTGTPAEARAAQTWINELGGRYLDCAIMVYPDSIGKANAQLLVSGPAEVFEQCKPIIQSLGGDIRFLGNNIGAAAALDMAVVTRLVTITVATVYGIHICESEGVALQRFTDMYPEGDRAHHLADKIDSDEYDRNIAATVGTSIEVVSAIQKLARELSINSELPDFILGLYRRAAACGCIELDNASLIRVFREEN